MILSQTIDNASPWRHLLLCCRRQVELLELRNPLIRCPVALQLALNSTTSPSIPLSLHPHSSISTAQRTHEEHSSHPDAMFASLAKIAVLAVAAVASTASAAWINHDAVPVWAQPNPVGGNQKLALKFKPQIKYENSCTAYPAVDAAGNLNSGLKPSGSPSAGCKDRSKQQIYARTGWYNNNFAIMYAWYMPKDSPSTGLGHRHEWENLVVWLSNSNEQTAKIVALSASAHGGYRKMANVDWSNVEGGVSPRVRYYFNWPNTHELGFTSDAGEKQPLIQWDQLTDAARNALESADFGKANVPFKSNFQNNLAKAWYK